MIEIKIEGEAQIASMQSGDVFLVKVSDKLSPEAMGQLSDALRDVLPAGVKTLIFDQTASFSILRPENADDSEILRSEAA